MSSTENCIIKPYRNMGINDVIQSLTETHAFLAGKAKSKLESYNDQGSLGSWGMFVKRMIVRWDESESATHHHVGKNNERFVELINILSTTERTLDALLYFKDKFGDNCLIQSCHPSTSDDKTNDTYRYPGDIVLKTGDGKMVCCEVNDVSASHHDSNGKEAKDLSSLGWKESGHDEFDCYIATSDAFGSYIAREGRKWKDKHYAYEVHTIKTKRFLDDPTVILKVTRGAASQ